MNPATEPTEETQILNCRVRRQPASLGNYHYHIEPGKKVYVVYRMAERTVVSTVAHKYRCSDDNFTVPNSFLS